MSVPGKYGKYIYFFLRIWVNIGVRCVLNNVGDNVNGFHKIRPPVWDFELMCTWVLQQDNNLKHTSKSNFEWPSKRTELGFGVAYTFGHKWDWDAAAWPQTGCFLLENPQCGWIWIILQRMEVWNSSTLMWRTQFHCIILSLLISINSNNILGLNEKTKCLLFIFVDCDDWADSSINVS